MQTLSGAMKAWIGWQAAIVCALAVSGSAAAPETAPSRDAEPPAATQCAALVGALGPERICVAAPTFDRDVCDAIARLAATFGLPEGYFARLIWQESRFDPYANSPAGAQGIAQFMPGTARMRGLRDSFAPAEALVRAAEYLRFLGEKYGNLGLAAAAYNAGEGRISRWVAQGGTLAEETLDYVMTITGVPIEQWLAEPATAPDYRLDASKPFARACLDMASARPMPNLLPQSPWKPWGVLIAQAFSPGVALQMFERRKARFAAIFGDEPPLRLSVRNPNFGTRLRHSVQLGRDSREEAEALCSRLRKAGGSCIVVRN